MTSDSKTAAPPTAKEAREARLAAALRDNLRRRKAAGAAMVEETGEETADRDPETEPGTD